MVKDVVVVTVAWLMDRLVPWSMLVSLALWWGKSEAKFSRGRMGLLIVMGIVEDIALVQVLGWRSAVLISLLMVAWLVGRYYQSRQLWWWYLLGGVGEWVMMELAGSRLTIWSVVGQILWLMGWQWWWGRFGKGEAIYVRPQ